MNELELKITSIYFSVYIHTLECEVLAYTSDKREYLVLSPTTIGQKLNLKVSELELLKGATVTIRDMVYDENQHWYVIKDYELHLDPEVIENKGKFLLPFDKIKNVEVFTKGTTEFIEFTTELSGYIYCSSMELFGLTSLSTDKIKKYIDGYIYVEYENTNDYHGPFGMKQKIKTMTLRPGDLNYKKGLEFFCDEYEAPEDYTDSMDWIDRDDFGGGFDHDVDSWNHHNQ